MTRKEIAESNPSLRRPVLNGEKRIPKGYIFQAPERKFNNLQAQYKKIPQKALYSGQLRSKWYTVRRGDTLSGVAIRFGTSVRSLKLYNNIGRRNRIYIGQVLQLPKGKSRPSFRLLNYTSEDRALVFYRIRRNDNLSKIAKRFRTDARYLAKINRIKNPNSLYPNQRIKVPQIGPSVQLAKLEKQQELLHENYYRVRRNDNLSKIAKRFDTDVIHLTSLNRMKDPNALYPGQKLLIAKNTNSTLKFDHTRSTKNSKAKVDNVQTKKSLMEGKSEIKPRDSISGETLKIVENSKNSGRLNKNRPAFMPVSFSSEKQESVGTITVDFDETLSHYADWALLSIRELKKINKIKGRGKIVVHDKLLVSFKKVNPCLLYTSPSPRDS